MKRILMVLCTIVICWVTLGCVSETSKIKSKVPDVVIEPQQLAFYYLMYPAKYEDKIMCLYGEVLDVVNVNLEGEDNIIIYMHIGPCKTWLTVMEPLADHTIVWCRVREKNQANIDNIKKGSFIIAKGIMNEYTNLQERVMILQLDHTFVEASFQTEEQNKYEEYVSKLKEK